MEMMNFLSKSREKGYSRESSAPAKGVLSKVIEYGLLSLLIFSPLPAASVYEWSILVIQLAVVVMMAAYVLMREKPDNNESLALALKVPKLLFLALFIFLLLQIIPFPKFLVKILSPSVYFYLEQYAVEFSQIKFMSFSLIPSFTLQRSLELLTYFLIGYLVIKTVTSRQQFQRIITVLIVLGAFEAFYGLFELYNKHPRILFYRKIHNLDSVTGTFVNRNHLSGYLEMIIPLAIGLLIARIDIFAMRGLTSRERLLRLSERGLSTNLFLFFAVILMSVAIIFSNSRSGVFILVFTFILFSGFAAIYSDISGFKKKGIRDFLKVTFVVILLISLYIGIDGVLQRFSLDRLLHEGRPIHWANTVRTFLDYPLFGTGLGTFGALYPPLEGVEGPIALVHAHNDYLEFLSELGIVGFSLLFGGILYMIVISFLVWRTRKYPEIKGLALGGIISLTGILIHSLTDFNLHIPANMVLFSVLLPLTMVIAFYKRRTTPLEKK